MPDFVALDLEFTGDEELVASFLFPTGDGGFVLFETGPTIVVDRLESAASDEGFALDDLRAIFLTHIHLDHGGAAGTLARRSGAKVYVHPIGAPHLRDPGDKLIPSAERIYGSRLRELWGEMLAVPEEQLAEVEHGDAVQVGRVEAVAWHTPGHASHHVAWQVGDALVTGDVAGIRFPGSDYVLPPTPPPDIHIETWRSSLELIRELSPKRLLLTHFGAFDDVVDHLDQFGHRLRSWEALASEVVAEGGSLDDLTHRLREFDDSEASEAGVPPVLLAKHRGLASVESNAAGMFRHANRPPRPPGAMGR
jgi:glyoxylase-like metal-dependent hydrolase (beta-lactamase superfamily II)